MLKEIPFKITRSENNNDNGIYKQESLLNLYSAHSNVKSYQNYLAILELVKEGELPEDALNGNYWHIK